MAQVSGIEINIKGNTSGLDNALDKAETSIGRFAKGAAAAIAGALSAGVFVAAGKAAIDFADAVGKTAQKVGTSTNALSELSYAAKLSDLTFSDLETGMRFLSKSMVTNAELFQQLGVAIQNSDGSMRSTDEVLMALSDKFAAIPDGVQKTALAMELFGRSGTALIPMLNAGSAGLEQMRQRAVDLGLSISEDTAKRAEQFNDTITDLAAVGQGAMMQLASAALPLAQAFLNVSVVGAEAMVSLGGAIQTIAPYAAVATAAVAGFYAPALLAGLATTTTAIGTGLVGAINAVKVALLANPIGLLVGALAAAAVAVFAFRDDIKSAIGVDVVGIAKDAANFVLRGFVNAADGIATVFKALPDAIGGALIGMSNLVLRTIATMANKAIGSINSIIDKINSLSQYTGITFERIGEVSAYQFTNKFADNFDSAWSGFMTRMGERANTDIVGTFSTAFGNAMSKANQIMTGGGGGAVEIPDLSGGGGDKGGKAKETSIAPSQEPGTYFTDRLDAIREQFKTEREVLAEEYVLNQEVLDNALANKLLSEQEYYDLSKKLAEEHQKSLASIQMARIQTDLAAASDFFGSMQGIAQQGGKKMLKVAKAFGAAQALVATFQAAAQAMADWSSFTPMQKIANFAAIVAQGMSAVRAIKGVSESGGGGAGASAGGGRGAAAMAGGGGAAAAAPTTTFQFTLMNDPMGFGEKFARQFIDQLNSTQRNGGTIRGVIA